LNDIKKNKVLRNKLTVRSARPVAVIWMLFVSPKVHVLGFVRCWGKWSTFKNWSLSQLGCAPKGLGGLWCLPKPLYPTLDISLWQQQQKRLIYLCAENNKTLLREIKEEGPKYVDRHPTFMYWTTVKMSNSPFICRAHTIPFKTPSWF
jgi:hypothetical protein